MFYSRIETTTMFYSLRRLSRFIDILFVSLLLTACGGGGGGNPDPGSSTGNPTGSYTVSVTTSGLTGSGLELRLSSTLGVDNMPIATNGTATFPTQLPNGTAYAVSITTQPSGQECVLGGSSSSAGIGGNANVTVTCSDLKTIGGSVTGLNGSLVLRLNGTNSVTLTGNGGFTFSTMTVATGQYYAVTVDTQPAGQLCLVSNAYGTVGSTSISNVAVTCSAQSTPGYKVGGSVSGFSGLVALNLNGTEILPKTYNGSFTFSTPLPAGASYSVTIDYQPPGYQCAVINGTGVMVGADYPFVGVECQKVATAIFPKVDPNGANLSTGETMVVTLNGTEDKTLSVWDFNAVSFQSALNPGDSYMVTVKTPPPGRVCALYGSVGVIKAGVIPVVDMSCVADVTSSFTIGGSVTGLNGSGLILNLDGRESLTVNAGAASYLFPNSQLGNMFHQVKVEAQPAGQICTVTNPNPWVTANVSNANVICSNGPHTIGGYVSGLTSAGLTLQLNGAETLPIPATGGLFKFATLLSDGMSYQVSILSQPTGQVCSLQNDRGFSLTSSISSVMVDCAPHEYTVGVNVTGYGGATPLLLQLNGEEIMPVNAGTGGWSGYVPKTFATLLREGQSYQVDIVAQPEGRICTMANPSGTINGANVTNIGLVCAVDPAIAGSYTVGVTTSGLLGSGLVLQLNGANDLPITGNGYTKFALGLASGAGYAVSVKAQPGGPMQMCKVVNGSGTVGISNVTNVSIQCGNAVESLYPANGGKWLNYVKNDGATLISATDTACDPAATTGGYGTCLNGGEFMTVALPGAASCAGITASDNLNAFTWTCDATAGVRVVSTGLKAGVNLSDLIDFTAVRFKPNFVTISGTVNGQTQPAIWWKNLVRVNNFGDVLTTPGEINLVTGSVPSSYTLINHSAVLIQPSYALAGTINANGNDFLWVEGSINGSLQNGLDWKNVRFSVVNNVQSSNNVGTGVYVSGNHLKLQNVSSSANLGLNGIEIFGSYISLTGVVANNNINGSGLKITTRGNISVTNATANGNGVAVAPPPNRQNGIEVLGNFSVLYPNHTFSNLTANGNLGTGVYIYGVSASSFANINAHDNGGRGVNLDTAENTMLSNINVTGNGGSGIRLFRWKNSKGDTLIAANNVTAGMTIYDPAGIHCNQCRTDFVADVTSSNNGGHGYAIEVSNEVISTGVTAVQNGAAGVAYLGGSTGNSGNILNSATSINNVGDGIEMTRMSQLQLSAIIAANNGGNGFYTYTFVDNLRFMNLVSANNGGYGFYIGSNNDYFGGLLHMGNNALGDCFVYAFAVQPGLSQGNPNNQCVISGLSNGVIVGGIDASSSLVGKVMTDDIVSVDDLLGSAPFSAITNWSQFEHPYRTWGNDGPAGFASAGNRGVCSAGMSCRIWDWSASISDAGNGGVAPAVYGVVPVPTVTDFLTITWNTTLATNQGYCDANYPGSVWDGLTSCKTDYLGNARELSGYGGNNNDLCERGETCLYMPNMGSYQGHGLLSTVGSVGAGVDTITLMQFGTVGR